MSQTQLFILHICFFSTAFCLKKWHTSPVSLDPHVFPIVPWDGPWIRSPISCLEWRDTARLCKPWAFVNCPLGFWGLLSLSPGPKGVFHLGGKKSQAPGQDYKPDKLQRYWVLEAFRVFLRFSPNSPISSAKDVWLPALPFQSIKPRLLRIQRNHIQISSYIKWR